MVALEFHRRRKQLYAATYVLSKMADQLVSCIIRHLLAFTKNSFLSKIHPLSKIPIKTKKNIYSLPSILYYILKKNPSTLFLPPPKHKFQTKKTSQNPHSPSDRIGYIHIKITSHPGEAAVLLHAVLRILGHQRMQGTTSGCPVNCFADPRQHG
jgi:hypothetical protein